MESFAPRGRRRKSRFGTVTKSLPDAAGKISSPSAGPLNDIRAGTPIANDKPAAVSDFALASVPARLRTRTGGQTHTKIPVNFPFDSDSDPEPPSQVVASRGTKRPRPPVSKPTTPHEAIKDGTSSTSFRSVPPISQSNEAVVSDPLDAFMAGLTEKTQSSVPPRPRSAMTDANGSDSASEAEAERFAVVEGDATPSLERKKRLVYEKVDHSSVKYASFRKELYVPPPDAASITGPALARMRRLLSVRVRGRGCPPPVRSFGECGVAGAVLHAMTRAGYREPTPIQAQAIPAVMSGRDVIGVARTGSGKTLAFVLPMLRHIGIQTRAAPGDGPAGLIIAPTRELAIQIFGEARRFGKLLGLQCVCAYGGSGVKDQIAELKRGADIVVCTPGRMIDLLAMNSGRITNLRRVTMVVLDEADRMFDMGFEPQLTRIVENVRPDRQTVMFSATFPRPVEALARKILKQPVEITVGGNSVAAATIEQHVEIRSQESKFFRLLELLGKWYEVGSTLVFVDRQDSADTIFRDLVRAKYRCISLHGGLDQADRDSAISDFKNGDVKILVATSVAARGLDVPNLSLVVNFDAPNHYEDYVHRVGRTGRAGRAGTAYTFLTPEQEALAPDLVKALRLSARAAADADENLAEEEAGGASRMTKAEREAHTAAREKRVEKLVTESVPPQLLALAEGFEKKRHAGIVKYGPSSGYGGKGFKFDDDSEFQKAQNKLRRAQAKLHGMDGDDGVAAFLDRGGGDDGDEDAEDEDDGIVVTLKSGPHTATASAVPVASKADDPAVSAAAAAAAAISAKLGGMLERTDGGSGVSDANSGDDNRRYMAELEINDYAQHARWQVTKKNALIEIEEFTGCVATTRGNYYPPGRNPPAGQRKLHFLIEGPSERAVKSACREIKLKLEEAASVSRPGDAQYSKYSVV